MSLNVPLFFYDSIYAYWKVRMCAFLKSIDERVWITVDKGWSMPEGAIDDVVIIKEPSKWTAKERESSSWNSKGIKAIFMSMSLEEFMRLSNYVTAKDA